MSESREWRAIKNILTLVVGIVAVVLLIGLSVRVWQDVFQAPAATSARAAVAPVLPSISVRKAPTPMAVAEAVTCRLDKIATIYEEAVTEPQRIEIAGHGVQHVDYYPNRGVKAVSYIVAAITPPEVPAIWWGFGSIWEGQLPECQDFDWEADAIGYASARLDSGHSGIVVDLRSGTPGVIANVANLSEEEVAALLAAHHQGQQGELPTTAAIEPALTTVGAQPGCPPAEDRTYATPTDVTVAGPAIVHPWWNNGIPTFGQAQVRVLLRAGESATFLQAMGKTYTYQDSDACRANLDNEFTNANFPIMTVGELESEGLVR